MLSGTLSSISGIDEVDCAHESALPVERATHTKRIRRMIFIGKLREQSYTLLSQRRRKASTGSFRAMVCNTLSSP